MPDVMTADSSIPNLFLQLDGILTEGEHLLVNIPPDQMPEEVSKALDQFGIARGLLGQLQSAVNVLQSGGEPDQPPSDHNLGRSDPGAPELLTPGQVRGSDSSRPGKPAGPLHAWSPDKPGYTLCDRQWVGRSEVRLGNLHYPTGGFGTVTCRFCRKQVNNSP